MSRADYRRWHWGRRSTRQVPVHRLPNMPEQVAQVGRLVLLELSDGRAVVFPAPGAEATAARQADAVVRLNQRLARGLDSSRDRRDRAVSALVDLVDRNVHLVSGRRPQAAGYNVFITGPHPVVLPRDFRSGTLAAITYQTAKGDRPVLPYRHEFEGSRPRLSTYATGEVRIERAGSHYDMAAGGITG